MSKDRNQDEEACDGREGHRRARWRTVRECCREQAGQRVLAEHAVHCNLEWDRRKERQRGGQKAEHEQRGDVHPVRPCVFEYPPKY